MFFLFARKSCDKNAIAKLTLLDNNSIEAMLTISTVNLKIMIATLSLDDMKCLSWYIAHTDQNCTTLIVSHAISNSDSVKKLCNEPIKNKLIKSAKKLELISFLLSPYDYQYLLLNDVMKIINGNITADIFFLKYNLSQIALMLVILLVVLFLLFSYIPKALRHRFNNYKHS
jgi:hypothetical protein